MQVHGVRDGGSEWRRLRVSHWQPGGGQSESGKGWHLHLRRCRCLVQVHGVRDGGSEWRRLRVSHWQPGGGQSVSGKGRHLHLHLRRCRCLVEEKKKKS